MIPEPEPPEDNTQEPAREMPPPDPEVIPGLEALGNAIALTIQEGCRLFKLPEGRVYCVVAVACAPVDDSKHCTSTVCYGRIPPNPNPKTPIMMLTGLADLCGTGMGKEMKQDENNRLRQRAQEN